jgi:hypothetical protein
MRRRLFTSLAAATAVAASVLISSGASASAQTAPPAAAASSSSPGVTTNPNPLDAVAVDTTKYKIVTTLHGVGKQVYDCSGTTYKFREPMAGLFTSRGIPAGIHGAPTAPTSPFWANFDGSRVVGDTSGGTPGFAFFDPNNGRDVKWLRVPVPAPPVVGNAGTGVFGAVRFIQRINTQGGVAPAKCDAPTVSVNYATDYVFWVDK